MADTEKIDKDTLPEFPKSYLKLYQTTNEMSTNFDEQSLFRILIDKINELVDEVNTLKNK